MNIGSHSFLGKVLGHVHFEGIQGNEELKVSLFILSKKEGGIDKVYRLKKIDLTQLNRKTGTNKLRKWSQDQRFVAVIETGDQIYAHTNEKVAKELQEKKVSFENKKIVIKALNDEEYHHLATVVQTFGEYVLDSSANEEEKGEAIEERKSLKPAMERYLSAYHLLNDEVGIQVSVHHLMDKLSHETISTLLSRMAESRRELEEQERKEEKSRRIKTEEMKKEESKDEVKKEEIKKKEVLRTN